MVRVRGPLACFSLQVSLVISTLHYITLPAPLAQYITSRSRNRPTTSHTPATTTPPYNHTMGMPSQPTSAPPALPHTKRPVPTASAIPPSPPGPRGALTCPAVRPSPPLPSPPCATVSFNARRQCFPFPSLPLPSRPSPLCPPNLHVEPISVGWCRRLAGATAPPWAHMRRRCRQLMQHPPLISPYHG